MQPHHPLVADRVAGDEGMARTSAHGDIVSPWGLVRRGDVTAERAREAYGATLGGVLPEVGAPVGGVEGRVAATADHGTPFGGGGCTATRCTPPCRRC